MQVTAKPWVKNRKIQNFYKQIKKRAETLISADERKNAPLRSALQFKI